MKKQLLMALSCLSFLCALIVAPLAAATSAQPNSEIEQLIAEKIKREEMDQEDFALVKTSKGQEIESVVNRALFYNEEEPITTHSRAWHFATGVSGTGNHVFLEDLSGWLIAASDAYKTLNWTGEHIIWVETAPWYSFFSYILHNHNTGVKVYANQKEPAEHTGYTMYIAEINFAEMTITLSDKTVWSFSGRYDLSVVRDWRVGQKVLIGINTSWWTSSQSPNLLISVEKGMGGYIRARCLY